MDTTMGTSTWHRSPETEAWKRVRELYAQPEPSPQAVVARIVAALEPEARSGLSDAAASTCLGTLLEGVHSVEFTGMSRALEALGVGAEPPALQWAAGLRGRAERTIAAEGYASRFGDLALDAVGNAALAIATRSTTGAGIMSLSLPEVYVHISRLRRERGLHAAMSLFVGHDLDRTFRYFVARDIGDFIGGAGIPSVSHANRFEDAVAAHCRSAWEGLRLDEFEDDLRATFGLPPVERVATLSPMLATGIGQGLDLLGAGGL
jgi:hypothetical protein